MAIAAFLVGGNILALDNQGFKDPAAPEVDPVKLRKFVRQGGGQGGGRGRKANPGKLIGRSLSSGHISSWGQFKSLHFGKVS